jgi:hypothetical protein
MNMARVVVIGLPGEDGLWVVDIDNASVTRLDPPDGSALGQANELRKAGATIVKHVDLAVAAASTNSAFSGFMDG